jgi:hypothetical protein
MTPCLREQGVVVFGLGLYNCQQSVSSKQEIAVKRTLCSMIAAGLCIAALALSARAQPALQIVPDRSVGVLSEDPSSGERWSASIFPFGNYVKLDSGEDVFCRTYLHFPLDAVPAGSTVQSAMLYVYVDDYWPDAGGAPMSAYLVTVDWTPEGVDWYGMSAWPALGGAVATTTVTSDEGWFAWDVTGLVQGWLGDAPNYGLAVAAADLSSTASNWATARRLTANDPNTCPYLDVVFVEPTATATPTPTPTATATPTPSPPPTATPRPPASAPPATLVPTPTLVLTPEPILLPITGQAADLALLWPALSGMALLAAGLGLYYRSR